MNNLARIALVVATFLLPACGGGGAVDPTSQLLGSWWFDTTALGPNARQVGYVSPAGWSNWDISLDGGGKWCRIYGNWAISSVTDANNWTFSVTYTAPTCGLKQGDTDQFPVSLVSAGPPPTYNETKVGTTRAPFKMVQCSTDYANVNVNAQCTKPTGLGAPTQNPPP